MALIKAMMVCMAKDLLVYTAAMVVGVINRKVIYKYYHLIFISNVLFPNIRFITRSNVEKTEFEMCIYKNKSHFAFIKCIYYILLRLRVDLDQSRNSSLIHKYAENNNVLSYKRNLIKL